MTDPAADSPMRRAVALCRRHVAAAFGFSALVNVLYIAPTLYMLQVYDRVLAASSLDTLLYISLMAGAWRRRSSTRITAP